MWNFSIGPSWPRRSYVCDPRNVMVKYWSYSLDPSNLTQQMWSYEYWSFITSVNLLLICEISLLVLHELGGPTLRMWSSKYRSFITLVTCSMYLKFEYWSWSHDLDGPTCICEDSVLVLYYLGSPTPHMWSLNFGPAHPTRSWTWRGSEGLCNTVPLEVVHLHQITWILSTSTSLCKIQALFRVPMTWMCQTLK